VRRPIMPLLVVLMSAGCGGKDLSQRTLYALPLTSTAFTDSDFIPARFTCDGANVSPPLIWSDAPAGTASYALIVDDPDAPGSIFAHWVIYDIPPGTTYLPEGVPKGGSVSQAAGARQGRNGFAGALGYGGPCPPKGPAHHYHFRLFALDKMLGLDSGATRSQVIVAMRRHDLGQGMLIGKYARR
jgi:Raf kinase inhibitor-like YbhB/YbcL family protein